MKKLAICLLSALFAAVASSVCPATTIYDNTFHNVSSSVLTGLDETGDDLHRVPGSDTVWCQFGISSSFAIRATVDFDADDATESIDTFGLVTAPVSVPVAVSQDTWMSVQLDDDSGQARLFDPPTVGTRGDLSVLTTGNSDNNFSTPKNKLEVSIAAPEPSTLALGIVGSADQWLGAGRTEFGRSRWDGF